MQTRALSPPMTPLKYHFRTPGSRVEGPIAYAVGQTQLGSVLVARSQRGICAIFLGDRPHDLRAPLAAAFPAIELQADPTALSGELDQVIAFIDRKTVEGDIHLDIGGTAFQQKVWQLLCAIPAGQTRSYRAVAHDLGAPQAVRAVAGACAANVLAIAIPCHRVVRSDGAIAGYRWGVERKRMRLNEEAAAMAAPFSA